MSETTADPLSEPLPERLGVVVVNYGAADMVLAALPALIDELARFAGHHVVLVDNRSPGDDGARLEAGVVAFLQSRPEADTGANAIQVIRSEVNGGFAAGNNIGFAALRALPSPPDAVLLLNPDATVRPGALAEMVRVLRERPKAGFVGPRLENPDGSTWIAAFNFPSIGTEVAHGLGLGLLTRRWPINAPDTDVPLRVDWVTGTATLVRWEALEAVGEMDEGYFLYYEEIDFMRMGGHLGWESWHAPAARILHEAGATTGFKDGRPPKERMPDYWYQAWARYFAKNHGVAYARAAALAKLTALALGNAQRSLRGIQRPTTPGFFRDFAAQVLLRRLTPLPASPRSQQATPR